MKSKSNITDDDSGFTLRRVHWDEFEITRNGITKTIKRGDLVKGAPRCFVTINHLYAAVKAAYGIVE